MDENDECMLEECRPERKKIEIALSGGDVAEAIRGKLSALLGLPAEEIEAHIVKIFRSVEAQIVRQIEAGISTLIGKKITEMVEARAGAELETIFQEALNTQILALKPDGKAIIETARKLITEKVVEFLRKKDNYNNRSSVEANFDAAMGRYLDQSVKDAIEEIKKESIERFNKAAMKKMMEGMATAIGKDKRLLSLMSE
jgi:hypothetical protein